MISGQFQCRDGIPAGQREESRSHLLRRSVPVKRALSLSVQLAWSLIDLLPTHLLASQRDL